MHLIDLKTLSGQLSLSVPTLRKLQRQGLPHYRPGRKVLVNPEEVTRWLDDHCKVEAGSDWMDEVFDDVLSPRGH
jgi:excisionase family DNA binding protein